MLEMELKQSGFLHEGGRQMRPTDINAEPVSSAAAGGSDYADARRQQRAALAAD